MMSFPQSDDIEAQWQNANSNSEKSSQNFPAIDPAKDISLGQYQSEGQGVVKPLRRWSTQLSKLLPWPTNEHETKVRRLEQCPKGYPRMSAFLDSDESFMTYRRFGWIQSRLLLNKQNEIASLEKELEVQDGFADDGSETHEYECMSDYKQDILKSLETKFDEYARLLAAAREMMLMRRPTPSEYDSVRNYCDKAANLSELEEEWKCCKEDLVTLRPGREHAWLDRGIENLLQAFHCDAVRSIFCSKETRQKTNGPTVLYTRSRIEVLAAAIITFVILVLLVVPTYVLYHLTNDIDQGSRTTALCIGVLLIFTLAFSAVLSLFTRARRHEILAAAAAYCAVLVVFLGNVPRPG